MTVHGNDNCRRAVSVTSQSQHGTAHHFWLDDVNCNGSEQRLEDCPHEIWGEHNCSPDEAAGVYCSNSDINEDIPPCAY